MLEMTNSRSQISFLDIRADDPRHRQADIFLAKTALDWQQTVELQEGLMMIYVDGVLSAPGVSK